MISAFLLIASSSPRIFHNSFPRTRKARGRAALMPLLALAFTWALSGGEATVLAATPAATTTSLAVTSGSGSATSVSSGSVVTLTAIVKAGATAVTVGQVNFCDASATYCTDIHILGTAQLTSAGTAVYKFRPGIGSHSYKAVFLGTASMLASSSSASALTVTGTIPPLGTTATMNQTGGWGAYALTATVTETGNTAAPTGLISFLDTNHGNAVLGTGALGTATRGVNWTTVNTSAPGVAGVLCAVADLNGDGIPDLFIKDYFGTYDVLLGNGDGTFTVVVLLLALTARQAHSQWAISTTMESPMWLPSMRSTTLRAAP